MKRITKCDIEELRKSVYNEKLIKRLNTILTTMEDECLHSISLSYLFEQLYKGI